MELTERLIELCGGEAPTAKLIAEVKEYLGLPPKAKTYHHITLDLPHINEDQLSRILDHLYANEEIGIINGWIHGVEKIDTSKWTSDDWDWYYGTGRFRQ